MRMFRRLNQKGIALLIVMLVTALLIALVFEFAYATRISLNSAVNFRDSQRAYFLALTGINAFKSVNAPRLRENIPAGTWQPFRPDPESDTVIMVRWEAEAGKIKITDVKTDPITQTMVRNLLENKRIDAAVYDRMTDQASEIHKLTLLSGLRLYMSDDEYARLNVNENFTVSPVPAHMIDINAASADVLQSMGISPGAVDLILQKRKDKAYTQQDITQDLINGINGVKIPPATGNLIKNYLTAPAPGDLQMTKVYSYATVGGYTKHVEAVLSGSSAVYWKAL